ncbi:acyl carrier protein [Anaerosacchariphilus sp. NSJ-68]|uniref:Acyl carrier protein n=2 Tax=Lachnospiraceae TaxID=186803 RepID=A0A923RLC4_9FIRM|nr:MULTISPECIES: acyl carrier protein [Lachnospiraceae]MBC5659079.1 acyl carrier protein [Anaerosacchariphilus hominis]MBC5698651.1 acyl carrier protein [Roseburia difficilis]
MFEQIKKIVAENLNVEEENITPESSFKEDLKADSLDLFEMVMALEEEFDLEIPSEDLEQLETVKDVMTYIESHKE